MPTESSTDGADHLTEAEAVQTLTAFERDGGSYAEVTAFFDRLPAVAVEEIPLGRWRGGEIATGHPMDGLLTASGWYGKQFDGPEAVHPLLFSTPGRGIFSVDPRRVPLSLAGRIPNELVARGKKALPVLALGLRTTRPRARLRAIEFRGTVSAAMVYDHLPIIDVFRRVDERTLLGMMDQRGAARPYFFTLRLDR